MLLLVGGKDVHKQHHKPKERHNPKQRKLCIVRVWRKLLGDVTTGGGDLFMGAGLQIKGGNVRQHPLTCEPATADPLALLRH